MKSFFQNNLHLINRGAFKALCLLLLFSAEIHAEGIRDTLILTHEISVDPLQRSSISESEFAFITAKSWNMNNREMTFSIIDLKTLKLRLTKIKIPTSIKILQCPTFCMNNLFLLIQDEYDLDWFLFKNIAGEFKFIEKLSLPKKTMAFNARVLNNHLFLLTDIYNHHPLDSTFNTSLCIYDAFKRKVIRTIHPDVPCIGLSHFPQNWISQNAKFIALAEPCGNKIQLYDLDLKLIRTINLPTTENWVNLPGNKLPIETSPLVIEPKSLIEELIPIMKTFSRIKTIHFANDSLLIVSCNSPDSSIDSNENYIYNVFDNKFQSPNSISISYPETKTDRVKPKKTFDINPNQQIRSGVCISLESENFIMDPNLTLEENEINKNNFYEKNDPEFIIRISKIEIK